MTAFYAWLTEYPDEGALEIEAPSREDALREAVSLLADGDEETEISVVEVARFKESAK